MYVCFGPIEGSDDAAEADVSCRRVDRFTLACCRAVAKAVVGGAEVRAPLDHETRNARSGSPAERVGVQQGCRNGATHSAGLEWGRRPLPDVPAHVQEPVAVRWIRADRRRALVAVELEVLPGELALPGVCGRLTAGKVLVAPGECGAFEPSRAPRTPTQLRTAGTSPPTPRMPGRPRFPPGQRGDGRGR